MEFLLAWWCAVKFIGAVVLLGVALSALGGVLLLLAKVLDEEFGIAPAVIGTVLVGFLVVSLIMAFFIDPGTCGVLGEARLGD